MERPTSRITTLRALAQRFSFLLLVFASIALMIIDKVEPTPMEALRARMHDAFTPILDAISRPAATAARFLESVADIADIYRENQELRRDNARLMQWKQAALRLEAENNSLRTLLQFQPEPGMAFVTGRVIAAPGGSFVRAFVVTAGRRHGVAKGQAAIAGPGMVGRVVEVGEWSSRILLLTDINTRIPVVLQRSRQRAVLAGDNSEQPQLLYLPADAPIAVGDRVVTSGHGGMFPPGLPIGIVAEVGERAIKVQPMVDLSRVEHIQIVDFGLPETLLMSDLGGAPVR